MRWFTEETKTVRKSGNELMLENLPYCLFLSKRTKSGSPIPALVHADSEGSGQKKAVRVFGRLLSLTSLPCPVPQGKPTGGSRVRDERQMEREGKHLRNSIIW